MGFFRTNDIKRRKVLNTKEIEIMKNLKNRLTVGLLSVDAVLLNSLQVHGAGDGLDSSGLTNWVKAYLNPFTTFMFWLIPIAYVIWVLIKGGKWYIAEANGEQQKPFLSTIASGTMVAVIALSINTLAKIFSIS